MFTIRKWYSGRPVVLATSNYLFLFSHVSVVRHPSKSMLGASLISTSWNQVNLHTVKPFPLSMAFVMTAFAPHHLESNQYFRLSLLLPSLVSLSVHSWRRLINEIYWCLNVSVCGSSGASGFLRLMKSTNPSMSALSMARYMICGPTMYRPSGNAWVIAKPKPPCRIGLKGVRTIVCQLACSSISPHNPIIVTCSSAQWRPINSRRRGTRAKQYIDVALRTNNRTEDSRYGHERIGGERFSYETSSKATIKLSTKENEKVSLNVLLADIVDIEGIFLTSSSCCGGSVLRRCCIESVVYWDHLRCWKTKTASGLHIWSHHHDHQVRPCKNLERTWNVTCEL